eukprot:s3226_g2.t1
MGPVGDSRGGCDVDSEAEEQLIRTFEDKSEISSSEEESLDSVGRDELLTRAVQGQADKKRMKELEGWRLHLENGHDEQSERQPVHDTLGEIPSDMFEELFGESFTPADEVKAVSPSEAGCVPEQAKLPWDEEYLPPDDDVLQEFAEELQTPVEQSVLRFFVGLKSKSGADVAAAVQRLILHINQSYPVRVLHCDPGTEFASDRLRAWLAGQAVRLQHTLPTDKRSNGLAERTVCM